MEDDKIIINDEAVIGTNDEASQCKRYAVHKGYWVDPFIGEFSKLPHQKAPEINMGYYLRVHSIDVMINHFLAVCGQESQIVNLGAGFDTTYWKLMKQGKSFRKFVEIDLPPVVYKKAHAISNKMVLQQYFKNIVDLPKYKPNENHANELPPPCVSHHRNSVTHIDHEIYSQNYDLICGDIRNIKLLDDKINYIYHTLPHENRLDFNKPTLFLTECVLVYLGEKETGDLLKWITNKFKSVICFLNYEQVNIGDHFGSVMLDNLKSQGCYLLGAKQCLNEDSQKNRFLQSNWDSAQVISMLKVFYSLSALEKHRILNMEFLDEKELLYQLLEHYCLCWVCKNIDYKTHPKLNANIEDIFTNL